MPAYTLRSRWLLLLSDSPTGLPGTCCKVPEIIVGSGIVELQIKIRYKEKQVFKTLADKEREEQREQMQPVLLVQLRKRMGLE